MKKVLIITYYWPPAGGPGVQRILRFVNYLPGMGWHPVILTVEKGDYPAIDESLLEKIPDECIVYKSRVIEPYKIYRKFTGKKKEEQLPTFIMSRNENESIKDRIAKWIRGNVFIPDARIGWIPYAVKAGLRIIGDEQIDIIFSSSPPHTVQLIARRLAKRTQIPWVADFRDPWTEAFWADDVKKTALSKRLDLAFEKSVLREADAVTTVSEGVSELFSAKVKNRYAVIQNGFEPLKTERRETEKFMILFIGHLSKHQNPETLFKAAAALPDNMRSNLQIIFVGRIFEGFKSIFEQYENKLDIVIKGYMPHNELIDFARDATLLFRPVARTAYAKTAVGAKTSDYLALRKPILTLGEKNSLSEKMLAETGSGALFEYEDVRGIADYIRENYHRWKKEKCIILDNEKKLAKYTTKYNVEKLIELFKELAEEKKIKK